MIIWYETQRIRIFPIVHSIKFTKTDILGKKVNWNKPFGFTFSVINLQMVHSVSACKRPHSFTFKIVFTLWIA